MFLDSYVFRVQGLALRDNKSPTSGEIPNPGDGTQCKKEAMPLGEAAPRMKKDGSSILSV